MLSLSIQDMYEFSVIDISNQFVTRFMVGNSYFMP
jgi:hypothetical protein